MYHRLTVHKLRGHVQVADIAGAFTDCVLVTLRIIVDASVILLEKELWKTNKTILLDHEVPKRRLHTANLRCVKFQ
jgi:hypothetical protein